MPAVYGGTPGRNLTGLVASSSLCPARSSPPHPRHWVQPCERVASTAGAATALQGDFGCLSWAALWNQVAPVAARLRSVAVAGREPGTPLQAHAVVLRPDRDELVVLLAHALAGIPLLPLHPALPEAEAQRLADAAACAAPVGGAVPGARAACARVRTGSAAGRRPLLGAHIGFVGPAQAGAPDPPRGAGRGGGADRTAALRCARPLDPDAAAVARRWACRWSCAAACAVHPIVLVPRFGEAAVWTAIARDGGTRLSAVPAIAHKLLADDRATTPTWPA
jgi:hypothetical protein